MLGLAIGLSLIVPSIVGAQENWTQPVVSELFSIKGPSIKAMEPPAIALWVYSKHDHEETKDGHFNDIADPWIERISQRLYSESEEPNKAIEWTEDTQAFIEVLKRYRRSGVRIKKLWILSHGSPGRNQIFSISQLGWLKDASRDHDLASMFVPGAVIRIESCSIGDDLDGAILVKGVGDALLDFNGGVVIAPRGRYFPFYQVSLFKGFRRYWIERSGAWLMDPPIDFNKLQAAIGGEARGLLERVKTYGTDKPRKGTQGFCDAIRREIEPLVTRLVLNRLENAIALEDLRSAQGQLGEAMSMESPGCVP